MKVAMSIAAGLVVGSICWSASGCSGPPDAPLRRPADADRPLHQPTDSSLSESHELPGIRFARGTIDLPASWRGHSTVRVLPASLRSEAKLWIKHALSVYPQGFLKKRLTQVVVIGGLRISGLDYAGTCSRPSTVYQVYDPSVDLQALEAGMHGEISSLLYYENRSLIERVGLKYHPSSSREVFFANQSLVPTDACLARGFYYPYAMSSPEEDFNSIAGALFTGDPDFWLYCFRYDKLMAKKNMVVKFYTAMDARMDEAFFSKLIIVEE